MVSVAEKLQKTPAQVALRWGIQMGHSVLPKSANESRIKENIDILDWSIPEDLMAKFSEIKQACPNVTSFFSASCISLIVFVYDCYNCSCTRTICIFQYNAPVVSCRNALSEVFGYLHFHSSHMIFLLVYYMQVRLLRAEFAVHPQGGYNTLEDFWDGEI